MMQKPLILTTSRETELLIAGRAKELRLLKKLKRTTLAENAGVSLSSLKRFETTGKISLESLLKLAHALGRLDEFNGLLKLPGVRSIKELEQRADMSLPKRGRR